MTHSTDDDYGIAKVAAAKEMPAPELPYRPPVPRQYNPAIGLIGCGGISGHHLRAYKKMGLHVQALCDIDKERALARQQEFYPQAVVYEDYRTLLQQEDIEVVDLATHPFERTAMIEHSLDAGKHVLSQKPFVTDLETGRRLVEQAHTKNLKMAVNQNGRWAPHFSYIREAIRAGWIGDVISVHQEVDWDHSWICGTEFEKIKHLILYDFAIHWFDIVSCFLPGKKLESVSATIARSPVQQAKPCMLAHVLADYEDTQVTWCFNADTRFGALDQTTVIGSEGTLRSTGVDLTKQEVTLFTRQGCAQPNLQGTWFEEGFQGTMGELLCAIEEDREPSHSAQNNLQSLELCFSVIQSADQGNE